MANKVQYSVFMVRATNENPQANQVRGEFITQSFAEVKAFAKVLRSAWANAANQYEGLHFEAQGNLAAEAVKAQTKRYGRATLGYMSRGYSDGAWETWRLVVIAS